MNALTVDQAFDIAAKIAYRQANFPDEALDFSVVTVLVNYGDALTPVSCVRGEWDGIKAELVGPPGALPLCPNGHPLLEGSARQRLGLVPDVDPFAAPEEQP